MDDKQAINVNAKDADGEEDMEFQEFLNRHEQVTNWYGLTLFKHKGFYIPSHFLKSLTYSEKHFKARDQDIIVATCPKSGTTWLKALTFSIAKRDTYDAVDPTHLLLATNPHYLVPILEYEFPFEDFEQIVRGCPRIMGTHLAHNVLPQSVHDSRCKIIHICRNPLDQFVSYYHFSLHNFAKNRESSPLSMNEALNAFCEGKDVCGPIWDHVLSYWEAHVKNPEKVLVLKYEDLKEDTACSVKKIAEFIGLPFSTEEEKQGVPEKMRSLCSLENLSNLEVNKNGSNGVIEFKSFFRKGIVGDWRNYLTPEMARRIETITGNKFEGTSLTF